MRTFFPFVAIFSIAFLGVASGAGCANSNSSSSSSACGDGQVGSGEQCDDGNTASGDGCSATCQSETTGGASGCGNGAVEAGEECDDGNAQGGDGCSARCQNEVAGAVICGDGKVQPGEDCDDGNATNGDGCSANCRREAKEVVCQTLAPLSSGTCSVTAGTEGQTIVGDVLTPTTTYRGGQVVVDASGKIAFVGCKADCDADATCAAAVAKATTVTCPQGVVSPGLINTHDHITYAQNSPFVNSSGERWEHRHEWRKGLDGHSNIPQPSNPAAAYVQWGELRFLMGGATSTIGSGGQAGLVRNLDRANLEEGLNQTEVNFDVFPLNDSTPPKGFPGAVECSAFSGIVKASDLDSEDAYLPHVGEGINAYANNEFVCLSEQNASSNVVVDKSAFIHGVGLTAQQYANMATNGTSLIWSPRSNISLYGNTASVTEAARFGVTIALGTDWVLSGSMNLLRELRCADSLNQTYFGKYFSDLDLWMMVTSKAAAVTKMDDVIGTLATGKYADIAIFDGSKHKDYRAIIDAEPQDVALVMRAGKTLYGDASIVGAMPNVGSCDVVPVCSSSKQICLEGEIGKTWSALQTAVGNTYDAFFCGTPTNEPSCVPTRGAAVDGSTVYDGSTSADDTDGDGIANASDNCPTVFNPIRPMDTGKQADVDGDGKGDVCDPCPLDANTTTCTGFDASDSDGDGVPNTTDNCPQNANATQDDADNDGKGDVCDACPTKANAGNAACPGTIYDIKKGTIAVGSTVALTNQLVTARSAQGYYLQVKQGDTDYDATLGATYSGVYVYDTANTVKAGDRVTLSTATIANYYDQIQLTAPSATVVTSLGEAPPAPAVVLPADVATGGAKAAAYESVIVEVDTVSVTSITPSVGTGDTTPNNEFVVNGSLRVNDALYLIAPFPTVGQTYTALRGILDYRNNDSKLELRDANDVVGAAAALTGFGPAQTFTDVGQASSPTFPTPLTVQLSSAPATDTFIAITSSDETALTVVGGGVTILAGQTTATVLVNGVAQSANVTLTATMGAQTLQANVRVIGAAEQPAIASLSPATASVLAGGTATFTVTLDMPAPTGGASVNLVLTPANAGTMPATVTIPANQLSATFNYVDASAVTSATINATLGASTASSTITVTTAGSCDALGHLVISEVRSRGAGGAADEFVELYNPTNAAVTLDNTWKLEARSTTTTSYTSRWVGTGKTIPAHGHFLIASAGYTQTPAADEALSTGITDAGSLRLTKSAALVDAVCYAFDAASTALLTGDATYVCEGSPLATNPHNNATATNTDASFERKAGGSAGNCTDTGNTTADFNAPVTPAGPQNSTSAAVP